MDNLDSLFAKGQYEIIVTLTEGSVEPEDIYFRVSSLFALNRPKDAFSCIEEHRDALYGYNPKGTLTAEVGGLLALEDYLGAEKAMRYYEEKPYVDIVYEEALVEYRKKIEEGKKKVFEKYASVVDDSAAAVDALNKLNASDAEIYSAILAYQKDGSMPSRLDEFAKIVEDENRSAGVRLTCLLTLVAYKYPKAVSYNRRGRIFRLIPKDTKAPFVDDDFLFLTKAISEDAYSPDSARIAVNFLSGYIMAMYPEQALDPEKTRLIEIAFIKIAMDSLREEGDLTPLLESYGLSQSELDDYVLSVKNILSAS